jgi:hypothetical protein
MNRTRIFWPTLLLLLLAAESQAALIFSTNATWRFFKGRMEASTPDTTAWRRFDFADSAFIDAPAPFWYDVTGDTSTLSGGTHITDMQNQYTCIFLRRTFVLTNITEFSALRFGALVDDGFVVWINGTEVQRVNVGTPGSAVTIGTLATGATEPVPFVFYDLLSPTNYLVVGTNVMAIQVFNTSSTSSDLDFNCSLSTTAPDPTPPTIASISPAPGTVNHLTQITVTFSEPVAGVNASDLLINGTPAASMSGGNDTYVFSFAQPAYGPVQITWLAAHGITDYGIPPNPFNATGPGATWQYNLVDNIPPTVAFQLPFAGVTVRQLTQIEVDFTEAVTGVNATDLLINGSPATSITALGPSQYVFNFPQPTVGNVQITWAANHGITDLAAAPNGFAGGGWTYVLDPNAIVSSVRLNELVAANVNGLRDEDNEPQDWVELYNTSSNSVSLAGWSLTDDENDRTKWVFPPIAIAGRGYLIVFCSGKDRKPTAPGSKLHTNFKLSPDGEFLGLYNAEVPRELVSSFNPYPNQRRDYSYGYDSFDQLRYFQTPSPGASNGTSSITGVVSDTKFSHNRGFYTNAFSLSITCATPGVTLRYTLNGSAPSATSGTIYTNPVPITNTTVVRALAYKSNLLPSDVDAQTYLFLDDVIKQSPTGAAPPGWPATWGGNVVDYGMDPEIVTNATYRNTIKEDLKSIPTLSIVMNLDDLFNASTGIYANPGGDGPLWERPCSLELIFPDDSEGFQINCGLRLRGGFSRSTSNPKHAFRVFFRQEYGASKLNYPLFGPTGAKNFDKFDIRTMQNYSWSFGGDPSMICLRDQLSRDAQLAMGQPSTRGAWYHLYINGQYWGLYNTEERPEASFGESYDGGREEDYDVIKQLDGYISGPTDGNADAWYRLWQAATNGFANDVDYFKVQGLNVDGTPNAAYENLVDVPNLIDYMLVILYGGNLDAPISNFLGNDSPNNWYGYRDRTGQHGGFKFVSHDAEHTLLNVNEDRTGVVDLANTVPAGQYGVINPDWTCGNPLTQSGGAAQAIIRSTPQYIWFRMIPNAEFRVLVADHVQKHCFNGGPLSVQGMRTMFMARSNEIQRAIVGESARWGDAKVSTPFTRQTWLNALQNANNNFVSGRTAVLINQLKADGLFPNLNAPLFNSYGSVVSNGFALYLTNNNGSGTLYYTLDGSDPRQRGGNISPAAIAYTPGTAIIINFPTTVRARVRSGTTWSAIVSATFYPAQDFSKLLFTEIMYNPPGVGATSGDEFEFLELKNAGTNVLDLSGMRFSEGIAFTFTNGTRVNPGQFFVLGRNRTTLQSRYPGLVVQGIYSGRLDNGGEKLTLSHALGTEVISVEYKDSGRWPLTPDGMGYSLVSRNPDSNPNPSNPTSWRASTNPLGSPGADDPASVIPAILINEALTHTDPPLLDSIELYNPTAADVNIGGWFLTDDGNTPQKFRIPDGTMIAAGGYRVFTEADFNPTPGSSNNFNLSSYGEEVYLFSGDANTNLSGYSHGFTFGAIENGTSFGRYVISTGDEHFVPQISRTLDGPNSGPRVGPIVISQIMYHPPDLPDGADDQADEFIEFRNITAASVALYDPAFSTNHWRVRGGVDFDFPAGAILGASQSLVLVSFSPADTAMLAAFRSKYGGFSGVPVYGPYNGKLDNSSDNIELQKPDAPDTNGVAYIIVDKVDYKDSAPWPSSADGSGAILRRLDLAAYGNDPANWIEFAPLTISAQPTNVMLRPGFTATFNVVAYGTGTLKYQWRKEGVNIPGATNDSLVLANVQLDNDGAYSVMVTDATGFVISAPASLFILITPAVLQAPLSQTVVAGGQVTLSCTITGNPPPFTYEWRLGSTPVHTNISNQRIDFYNFTAPSISATQSYRVVVKNPATPATGVSHPTFATIVVLADSDHDGIPDEWESVYGLNPTNALDALADSDGDSMSNRAEYIAGTDPTDATSYLKVEEMTGEGSFANVTFIARSNKTYTVQCKDDLAAAWRTLADLVAQPTNHLTTVVDPGPLTNRFYRLVTPQLK